MENHIDAYLLVELRSMAGVHQYGWKVIPAVRQDMAQILFRINVVQKASADSPYNSALRSPSKNIKFLFPRRWHKGLFPRHYVCLRLTVNT